ncbi:hypothetical protein [Ralstonia pickettii]|jgi:hypothetical protein|uniref:hypothetical protein n=1 Tax=Ralstonia pickettii TaxID=329 RepID=UPI0015FAF3B3|nr:hypothetical protein [Ralstonia pickettii]MBB0022648.1 hypothetical protein [Ralstonia pickettii]MBB0033205.1 hypothetical protein [Ralstonia pickettii]MBB0096266.1 hypothetical protein [Ralstonia pickettii]MBB0105673.1 hypothetical protein [Ralstonia pickettii]MBB0127317.1 hypothetical protein [Ralstonia pickettii]
MNENDDKFDARTATEAERRKKLAEINRGGTRPAIQPDEGFDARTATPEEVQAQAKKLGGRITPKDVNVFLRRSGEAGQKLSDDGLVGMMALVLQEKKAAGE